MSAESEPSRKPLLFISHKHADKKIADVIREFVSDRSAGGIEVFQSSSPWAGAPRVGRNLNKELKAALWRARSVILIYTTPDQDWTYCIYECGVASHPASADSNLIVFQCAGVVPVMFTEQVNVNARKLEDIQRFTNEFLTSPAFLPGFGGPITDFASNSAEVARAAAQLFEKLSEPGVLPAAEVDPNNEWPAYPYIQFELSESEANSVRAQFKKRRQLGIKAVEANCLVVKSDKYAEQLFGAPSFPAGTTLTDLKGMWRNKYPKLKAAWVQDISTQICDGVMWRFPKASWKLMRGPNDDMSYAPVLNYVRRNPSQQSMQFDVYFYRFTPEMLRSIKGAM